MSPKLTWTRAASFREVLAFIANRPVVREDTAADGLDVGYNDVAQVAYFADGSAIAIVTDIDIRGPYSEVTPDIDVSVSLKYFLGTVP